MWHSFHFLVHLKSADDDVDVDVVGSGEESMNQSNIMNEEMDKEQDVLGENSLTLEKLLQDLQTSPQHDESDDSGDEEDDFPFDDGDDDDGVDDVEQDEEGQDNENTEQNVDVGDVEDNEDIVDVGDFEGTEEI